MPRPCSRHWTTSSTRRRIPPAYLRYLFRYCVQADVETAVGAEVWRRSLDDRLIDCITPVFSDLEVTNLPLGYTPFVVRDDAGDRGA